jgi:ubiquitin-activating enzyme E1
MENQNIKDNKINLNLYSRQLGIIDLDAMKILIQSKFLIIGLRGLGVEICKNLILEGPNRVDIYDPNYITINDLNSNFFVTEKDLNKIRDETIIERLNQLNQNVECKVLKNTNINGSNYEDELLFITSNIPNYNMIIITEFVSKNTLTIINKECRKLNKAFIYTCALGLSGFLFNDFGKEHTISSPYGKDDNFYPIKKIKKGVKTIIEIDKSLEGYPNISDDSFVRIIDIKGMIELKKDIIYKTKYISISEFEIDINSTNFSDYIYGGFIQVVSIPVKIEFKTFEEDLLNPMKDKERDFINIPYIGRNDIVHSLIIALYNKDNKDKKNGLSLSKRSFIIDSGLLPDLNDKEKSKELTEIAKNYYNNSKNNKEKWIQTMDLYDEESELKEFEEDLSNNLSLYFKAEIPPIVSFLGGIVAQEIVKITGKFSPFNQWFEFEFNYLSTKFNKNNEQKNLESIEISRYNEQIQIFGKEVQNKLASLNIFLVGAGAIGCEYLKNFAMMGVSCKNESNIGTLTLTDFDKIELSNLNRQFLFRESNIGQFKSEVAKNFVNKINSSFNINSYSNPVSPETENIFSDYFWDNQDIIFNAVDNVKARMYLNEKVEIHQKFHVDAGTLGVNSSSCFFLKNLSSTYKEQNFDKKEEDDSNNGEIGMCTIHSFPTSIKHCIEWARNEYQYLFSEFIIELKQILQGNTQYLYKLLIKKIFPFYKNLKIEDINNYLEILISKSYIKAIQYSFIKFMIKFNLDIKDILKEHPEDSKDENGNNFYIGSKHVPVVLNLNVNKQYDNLIICYVKSYANLIFNTLGFTKNDQEMKLTDEEIKCICMKTNIPSYDNINKKNMVSKVNYNKEFCQNFVNIFQNKLIKEVNSLDKICLNEIIFSKDNIDNSQYDFIYSCSNLRAINFQIPQSDFLKIKNISAKIVPSIVTSNAVITGLSSMQLYMLAKLMIEKENNNNILDKDDALKLFRNYYINLGLNGYTYCHLPKRIIHNKINDIPKNWTTWDSILLYGPLTIKEFIKKIEEKYEVKIISIHSGKSMIYKFNDDIDINKVLIENLYQEITKTSINANKKYLIFYLISKTKEGDDASLPRIKYCLINK